MTPNCKEPILKYEARDSTKDNYYNTRVIHYNWRRLGSNEKSYLMKNMMMGITMTRTNVTVIPTMSHTFPSLDVTIGISESGRYGSILVIFLPIAKLM